MIPGTRPASSGLGGLIFFREVKLPGQDDFYSPQSIVEYSYNKNQQNQQDALFFYFIWQRTYIFRTELLSVIRSLNTVFTVIRICHNSYVDCCYVICLSN